MEPFPMLRKALTWALRLGCLYFILREAYTIRLHAIKEYGRVIHEFDPWFNFRATQYLADNGWERFFKWFDHMSWYPLGRPVGTTIYPGMQITAVGIWKALNAIGGDLAMSLNDVCCFVPAWFGAGATFFLALLTYECARESRFVNAASAAVGAAAVMSIVPAHIMRSVGGGFDNESVAITALCSTFYFWCRSLRDDSSWVWGVATGLAYINMAAAWGGYIFVLNMIGVHASLLVVFGRYTKKLCYAYSLFYGIGTLGAMQVPVIGTTPLRSLEQLGPCLTFIILLTIEACERRRRAGGWRVFSFNNLKSYFVICLVVGAILAGAVALLWPTGYFGPLSARIRGLFVKHTRTGNPLVDSVAEHQPATRAAYYQYLHYATYVAPVGAAILLLGFDDAPLFLLSYISIAYWFSAKMMRLILLMGPITSALAGVAIGWALDFVVTAVFLPMRIFPWLFPLHFGKGGDNVIQESADAEENAAEDDTDDSKGDDAGSDGDKTAEEADKPTVQDAEEEVAVSRTTRLKNGVVWFYNTLPMLLLRMYIASQIVRYGHKHGKEFYDYSHQLAAQMSHPSIMFKGRLQNGQSVTVDDYREAYWWLRDNTPADSRVMAWWDYGYQLAGIANRTTIADGNTWNHEHIATLGRCLTSPEKEAHRMVRHLADYVLVWTGGGGDDLAKSPHMARIGNSVYEDICPGDPTCQQFGFMQGGYPTKMMSESLLYRLHSGGQQPGVTVDHNRFRNVYNSKYNKVRIWKVLAVSEKSKKWCADPANRVCDAPGSWYCVGKYPPLLRKLFKKRGVKKKSFRQLEDFNKKKTKKSEEYNEKYMKNMDRQQGGSARAPPSTSYDDSAAKKALAQEKKSKKAARKAAQLHRRRRRDAAQKSTKAAKWADTDDTAKMQALIEEGDLDAVQAWLERDPEVVFMRSADGRGPLWWAKGAGQKKISKLLSKSGAQKDAKDKAGNTPKDMRKKSKSKKNKKKKTKKTKQKQGGKNDEL